MFSDGLAFDGSSIRGFQAIHESDMLLLPDVSSAFVDPFRVEKTVALNFFIHDPFTREAYSRDPRNVAKKAEAYLKSSGIADTAYFGPEAEFYIFDSIRHETSANQAYYYIDSIEGWWNSGNLLVDKTNVDDIIARQQSPQTRKAWFQKEIDKQLASPPLAPLDQAD